MIASALIVIVPFIRLIEKNTRSAKALLSLSKQSFDTPG
jgi:hypothetical protein